MDDALWDLGLSDAALTAIFALVMIAITLGIVVWAAIVPEKAPEPEVDHVAEIVDRSRERASRVERDLEHQTGRSDPAVAWTH